MPHVDDQFDQNLPSTPPRDDQAAIPKEESTQTAKKAQIGLLPTLSIQNYEPDPKLVEQALGNSENMEVQRDPGLRFQQPQFGSRRPLS